MNVFITLLICIGVIFIFLLLKNDYVRYSKIEDFIDEIDNQIEVLEEENPQDQFLIDNLKHWRRQAEKLF